MTLDSFSKDDINYIINEVTERVYKSLSSGDEFKTGISVSDISTPMEEITSLTCLMFSFVLADVNIISFTLS